MFKKWAEKGEMQLKLGFKRILRVLEVGGSMPRDSFKKSENRQKVVGVIRTCRFLVGFLTSKVPQVKRLLWKTGSFWGCLSRAVQSPETLEKVAEILRFRTKNFWRWKDFWQYLFVKSMGKDLVLSKL